MSKLGKRKQATDWLLNKFMDEFDKTGRNTENLKTILTAMTDEKFHEMVLAVRAREAYLPFILDHLTPSSFNLSYIEKFGKKFFGIQYRQRIRYKNPETGEYYWSNSSRWVLDIPVRRLIQSIENKISVSTSKQVNAETNQPVGNNKAASISGPESLILEGQGFEAATTEFMVVRGGDLAAKHALDQSIRQSGGASLNTVMMYGQGAKAVSSTAHKLTAMHWKNNLKE